MNSGVNSGVSSGVSSGVNTRVSVVVTCFKQADLIERMLPLLLDQLHDADEVIISDDGSDDGSADRLETRFAHDARVRVLSSIPTRSVARNRNRGLRASSGDWVTFLDGDDHLLPGWRSSVADVHADAPLDLLFADYQCVRDGVVGAAELASRDFGELLRPVMREMVHNWQRLDGPAFEVLVLAHWVPFITCSVVYRRAWLLERDVWYDARFPASEDTDFQLRALQGARIAFRAESLSRYERHMGGLSSQQSVPFTLARHVQRFSMLQLPAMRRGSPAEDAVWRRVAHSERLLAEALLREGDARCAQRHALRSFVTAPAYNTACTWWRATIARLTG